MNFAGNGLPDSSVGRAFPPGCALASVLVFHEPLPSVALEHFVDSELNPRALGRPAPYDDERDDEAMELTIVRVPRVRYSKPVWRLKNTDSEHREPVAPEISILLVRLAKMEGRLLCTLRRSAPQTSTCAVHEQKDTYFEQIDSPSL